MLTKDDPYKADSVEKLLLGQADAGSVELVTAEMVIAEIGWYSNPITQ